MIPLLLLLLSQLPNRTDFICESSNIRYVCGSASTGFYHAMLDPPPIYDTPLYKVSLDAPPQDPLPPPVPITVSFSGQGAQALYALTGKRIPGLQLVQATICSPITTQISVGEVIQLANAHHFQTQLPEISAAIVRRTSNLNWRNVTVNTSRILTGAALVLVTGGTIAATPAWQVGLALAHTGSDALPGLFSLGTPDPSPFLNSVVPADSQLDLVVPAGSDRRCRSIMLTAVYGKSTPVLTGPLPLRPPL